MAYRAPLQAVTDPVPHQLRMQAGFSKHSLHRLQVSGIGGGMARHMGKHAIHHLAKFVCSCENLVGNTTLGYPKLGKLLKLLWSECPHFMAPIEQRLIGR